MKRSNIYIIAWLLMGIGLAIVDWRWTVVWVISGYLSGYIDNQKRKESMPKKGIPSYIT